MTMSSNHITRLGTKDKAWEHGARLAGGAQKCSSCSYVTCTEGHKRSGHVLLGEGGMACGVDMCYWERAAWRAVLV